MVTRGWKKQTWLRASAGLVLILIPLGAALGESAIKAKPASECWPADARRVVMFEAYEMVAALGAWDRIVGISRYAYDNDLLQRVVPHLRQIPAPGTGFAVNLEALLALKPDAVVIWSVQPELVDFLRRKGLRVLTLYPETLADLKRDLLRLGRLLGKEARAREVAAMMAQSLDKLRHRLAAIPAADRPGVVWLWSKPTKIGGNRGIMPELITLTGGINLGSHLNAFYQELSMETIVGLNPEVVLIWGSASYGPADILHDPKWQSIRAVKTQRVFKSPRASNWSPRVISLAWWMAHCLHPQQISPAEMQAELDQFYRRCFGIPYQGGH
ncbi:MAG: ABC transporter substrate-binding protein [Deltaproteobacteria bacterium]|nr:ABC transporter substrate-binding protein [Deltaproteobacteria bacterium]